MILKTRLKVVGKYKGKSKFDFFKRIEVGDILEPRLNLNQKGGYYGGNVTEVSLYNLRTTEEFKTSLQILNQYLSQIETIEI